MSEGDAFSERTPFSHQSRCSDTNQLFGVKNTEVLDKKLMGTVNLL